MTANNRKLFRRYCLLVSLMLALCGCAVTTSLQTTNMGPVAYTMKTLDGLFFPTEEYGLCLISGTETPTGESQVFVYSVDRNETVLSQTLQNACSMTAFCAADGTVYFGTISRSRNNGSDLYLWDTVENDVRLCAHIQEKGIYSLAWDSDKELLIGTAYNAMLYGYDVRTGRLRTVCAGFTDQPYVRSLSFASGVCYAGLGSRAGLVAIDTQSGEFREILPEEYRKEAFVYAQSNHDGTLYLLLSPSPQIIAYDTETGRFHDTGVSYGNTIVPPQTSSILAYDGVENLLGNLLFFQNGEISAQFSKEAQVAYLDVRTGEVHTLDMSGIYRRFDGGALSMERDLSDAIKQDWIAPVEFLAYDDILYIPWRRFIRWDLNGEPQLISLVKDEPQAATVTEDGVYTTNYTECTVYYYPFSELEAFPAGVSMNDERYLLADIDHQCRPTQMEVTPDGRYLVIGSGPLYGNFGGAVSVYDLRQERLVYTHENVVKSHKIQSVKCSAVHPGCVWLGTNPYGENTTPTYLDEPAHLILWDIEGERVLLDVIPEGSSKGIAAIAELGNCVYCVTSAGVYCLDTNTGELLRTNQSHRIHELIATLDGKLLGSDDKGVYSFDPVSLRSKTLASGFSALTKLTEDPVTGALYVFDGTDLIRLGL